MSNMIRLPFGEDRKLTEHFHSRELRYPDYEGDLVANMDHVTKVEAFRAWLDVALYVTDRGGHRPGKSSSQHYTTNALDVYVLGRSLAWLEERIIFWNAFMGDPWRFNGVGTYPEAVALGGVGFMHIDSREGPPKRWVRIRGEYFYYH